MIVQVLATPDELGPVQEAIRKQFQKGGTVSDVLLGFGVVLGILALAWWLTRRQQRAAARPTMADPWAVFHDLARRLDMTHPQRRLLVSIAGASGSDHPTTLLVSERLFDESVDRWRRGRVEEGRPPSSEELRDLTGLRTTLFPHLSPWVFGGEVASAPRV